VNEITEATARVMPGMLEVADRQRDELWELSVARDAQRKREDLDALRLDYHLAQAERHRRTLSRLVQFHEAEAEKLMKGSAA